MKFSYLLHFLFCISILEAIQAQVLLNELNIGEGWIELRNTLSTNIPLNGAFTLKVYKNGNNEVGSADLTGTIAANGFMKFDFTRTSKRRKRSAGGSIPIDIVPDSSGLITIDKPLLGYYDSLAFRVSNGADQTEFQSVVSEWDNKYLLYSTGKSLARIGDGLNTPGDWEVRNVGTPDAPNGASGDPHFIQTVIDIQTNKSQKLCYDVTGKAGNKIFILADKLTDIRVFGILLNDYYMHSIQIFHHQKIFSIKIQEIILDDGSCITWGKNNSYKGYRKNLDISIHQHNVYFKIKNINGDGLNIIITRRENPLIGNYLDVNFDNLKRVDKRYHGVIGHIGNQPMAFLNPIQNNKYGIIKIDRKLVKSEKQMKNDCWLVKFEDAIAPKRQQDFIF